MCPVYSHNNLFALKDENNDAHVYFLEVIVIVIDVPMLYSKLIDNLIN